MTQHRLTFVVTRFFCKFVCTLVPLLAPPRAPRATTTSARCRDDDNERRRGRTNLLLPPPERTTMTPSPPSRPSSSSQRLRRSSSATAPTVRGHVLRRRIEGSLRGWDAFPRDGFVAGLFMRTFFYYYFKGLFNFMGLKHCGLQGY